MGNTSSSSRESRGADSPSLGRPESGGGAGPTSPTARRDAVVYNSRTGRGSRPDLSFLGIGSSSNPDQPERRETRQEREARKLEKERAARAEEREKSIKEEHVDGGFVVTMGVYTGTEDFNKTVVRQLMIERRIAPFWRGLNDFKEEWTEHQLVAAGRGLPIPAADEIPQEDLTRPISPDSPHTSSQNLQNLTVPISGRSQSAASDTSANLSPSHPAFSNAASTSSSAPSPTHSSPFRPRSKTLASLTTSLKTPSSTEMIPREIQLAKDPFVNGQAIEVFLYKDATECPICFLYYPPYLNKTRCCDQPICSECFVQIKRPDPHPPEHEHNDPSNPAPPVPVEPSAESEMLVSEPSTCPYCQQPEFGVTYDPPPFRRGLSYASPHGLGTFSSAMSSSSSLASTGSPTTLSPQTHKRRTTSISATASTVITTDRVRPDWATKLANARSHLARRSAAATALHTAAYLIGNGNADTRSFGFSGRSRFGRHRGESSPGASGSATPSASTSDPAQRTVIEPVSRRENQDGGSRRRRVEDLEEMMMMEAIRLSLAAEEERKKRAEKDAQKEAKKKAKEDKKKEKKEKKAVYGSGGSSASGSALSLSLPGLGGRRRGNSGGSNLAREVTAEDTEPTDAKGKGVARNTTPPASAPIDFPKTNSSPNFSGIPGARHLDTSTLANISETQQTSSSSPTAPEKPSHLRQMSNASSPASSFMESVPNSLRNNFQRRGSSSSLDTPNASGTNLAGHSGGNSDVDDTGLESMFNFQSLAAAVGEKDEDKADAARHIEHLSDGAGESSHDRIPEEDSTAALQESVGTLTAENVNSMREAIREVEASRQTTLLEPQNTTPEVMITPVTPAEINHGENDRKQLGAGWTGTEEVLGSDTTK